MEIRAEGRKAELRPERNLIEQVFDRLAHRRSTHRYLPAPCRGPSLTPCWRISGHLEGKSNQRVENSRVYRESISKNQFEETN